jgi:hypothetical protein
MHHHDTKMEMPKLRASRPGALTTARTVRFPRRLRARIAADAVRCGRSFEAQVLAILRHHYGESVDIAPSSALILALAEGSLAGVPEADRAELIRRLVDQSGRRSVHTGGARSATS